MWQVELTDRNIDIVSKMQRFTYRCLSMFGPDSDRKFHKAQKKEFMETWVGSLFRDYKYKLTFDKSLWLPNQPELYENIVKLEVNQGVNGAFFIHEINFNESSHDIFSVEYTKNHK